MKSETTSPEKFNIRTVGQLIETLEKYPREKEFIFLSEETIPQILLPFEVIEWHEGINIHCGPVPITKIEGKITFGNNENQRR